MLILKAVLKQLTAVVTILRNESVVADHVISQPTFPSGEVMKRDGKKIPLVKLQYKFRRKQKTHNFSHTSMKAFRNNPENRLNHINSYKIGLGNKTDAHSIVLRQKTVYLNVKKSRTSLHVDGITFVPTIGGIVVGLNIWNVHIGMNIWTYDMNILNVHNIR